MSKQKEIKEKALILQTLNESIIDLENLKFIIHLTRSSDLDNKREMIEDKVKKIKNKIDSAINQTKYWN
jgi:hypothetical protein